MLALSNNFKRKVITLTPWIILILAYVITIWQNFTVFLADISNNFGYLDYQNNWRALDDFIHLKIPFKDYYFEYGWLFLAIQSVPYVIYGQTHLAILISRELVLPIMGVIVSCIVAKIILKKNWQIFTFLIIIFFYRTTYNYASLRHLIAELGLALLIVTIFNNNKKKNLFIPGIIVGLSVLTALEYGIALNITLAAILLIVCVKKILTYKDVFKFYTGQFCLLVPYIFVLLVNNSLINYLKFTSSFMKNFYYTSPCSGDSYPRFSDIQNLSSYLVFLSKLNFYLVPIFFLITLLGSAFFIFYRKRVTRKSITYLGFSIYGLGIYTRTLTTPCLEYFSYGLVPFFLLVVLSIGDIKKNLTQVKQLLILKILLVMPIIWLVLTGSNNNYLIFVIGKISAAPAIISADLKYYPKAGWKINNNLVDNYSQIENYINKNTSSQDYLYVFPWGPYNIISNRKNPTAFTNSMQATITGEYFMNILKDDLAKKKPKYVIVNTFNSQGTAMYGKERFDVPLYFSRPDKDGPVFAGDENVVEKYILEHYETIFYNPVAIVMKRLDKPINVSFSHYKRKIWPGGENTVSIKDLTEISSGKFRIIGENPQWKLTLKKPQTGKYLFITFKVDGDSFSKSFSRYFVNTYIYYQFDSINNKYIGSTLATKDWQVIKIKLKADEKTSSIMINFGKNTGFLWFLRPHMLSIGDMYFIE